MLKFLGSVATVLGSSEQAQADFVLQAIHLWYTFSHVPEVWGSQNPGSDLNQWRMETIEDNLQLLIL